MSVRPSRQVALALEHAETDDSLTIADFLQFGKRDTVRRYLNRQTERGNLQRVLPSIYVKAKDGLLLAPIHPIKLGKTIGRSKACQVWPLGESALYAFGLIPHRLSAWTFASTRYIPADFCAGEKYLFRTRVLKEVTGWTVNSLSALEAMSLLVHSGGGTDALRKIKGALTSEDCQSLAQKAESLEEAIVLEALSLFRLEFEENNSGETGPNSPQMLFEECAARSFQELQIQDQELTEQEKRTWELRT